MVLDEWMQQLHMSRACALAYSMLLCIPIIHMHKTYIYLLQPCQVYTFVYARTHVIRFVWLQSVRTRCRAARNGSRWTWVTRTRLAMLICTTATRFTRVARLAHTHNGGRIRICTHGTPIVCMSQHAIATVAYIQKQQTIMFQNKHVFRGLESNFTWSRHRGRGGGRAREEWEGQEE